MNTNSLYTPTFTIKTPLLSEPESNKKSNSEWKTWSECNSNERWVIVGKIALALFVMAVLATACVFTGFVGLGLVAALTVKASLGSYAIVGAVFGVSFGLGVGSMLCPYFAVRNQLHQHNKKENKKKMLNFTLQSLGLSALSAVACGGTSAAGFVGIGAAVKAISSINCADHLPKHNPHSKFSCSFNMGKNDLINDIRRQYGNRLPDKPPSLPSTPPSLPPSMPPPSLPPSLPPSVPPSLPGGGGFGGFGGI